MAAKKLTVEQIKNKIDRLKSERSVWESHWQEVTEHVLPRRSRITTQRTEGRKENFQLLDSIGVHCNEILAGMLHSMLTPPNQYFMEMTSGVLAVDSNSDARGWMQRTSRRMHSVWSNSNFHTEMHELYLDLPSIGTGNLEILEDDKDVVRFSSKFIGNYYVDENSKGDVDQLFNEWHWTPKQLIEEFGIKNMPKEVKEMFKEKPDAAVLVHHAVYPTVMVDPKSTSKRFISQYTLPEYDFDIDHGTFSTFPNAVPRWSKISGEKYGRSLGMNALPELKVLNRMNQTMLIGAQKMVDPPLQMDDDGVVLPLITRPGGVNFRRPGSSEIRPIFANTNVEFGYQAMADRRQRVRDIYLVDKLQLPPQNGGAAMTATETLQRSEESMRLMGPYTGRMLREILIPVCERTYDIMNKRGMIEEPPEILRGRDITFRFTSFIAKAQRASEASAILRTLQSASGFMQMDPKLVNLFNGEQAVRILADIYGAPVEVLQGAREYNTIVQNIAAQQQAALQAQQSAMATQQDAAIVAAAQQPGG